MIFYYVIYMNYWNIIDQRNRYILSGLLRKNNNKCLDYQNVVRTLLNAYGRNFIHMAHNEIYDIINEPNSYYIRIKNKELDGHHMHLITNDVDMDEKHENDAYINNELVGHNM